MLSVFSLQNAVCFIILTYLVPVLFTFYIQGVLNLKKNISGAKRLNTSSKRMRFTYIMWELPYDVFHELFLFNSFPPDIWIPCVVHGSDQAPGACFRA